MSYDAIPQDMRQYNQWITWRYDLREGKPTKVPYDPNTGRNASVTDPRTWGTFAQAVSLTSHEVGLGFVFTKGDPFVGIDFDNKTKDEELHAEHLQAIADLGSYTEWSPSGTGMHVIVRGVMDGSGRRNGQREIYDNQRFFTMTGNILYNYPIADRQATVDLLVSKMGTRNDNLVETHTLEYANPQHTNERILEIAKSASNGASFSKLYAGHWQGDFKSQSEADLALMNMLVFYSRNRQQCYELFNQSGLYRKRVNNAYHIARNFNKALDQATPIITLPSGEDGDWSFNPLAHQLYKWKLNETYAPPVEIVGTPTVTPAPVFSGNRPPPVPPMRIPGLVGELVEQCWNSATHKIAEVAIASALSTMSVLCSRTYKRGTMGLNLYLLVLAPTSTGKSFGFHAIDQWHQGLLNAYAGRPTEQYKQRIEFIQNMVIDDVASAAGLSDHMPKGPSTLYQADEFVDKIKMMSAANPSPNMAALKTELLRLVEKSGPGRVYRGRKLSKAGNKPEAADVASASLTMLATGVPQAFYDDMSSAMLTNGFLPRFTILEYNGGLTDKDNNPLREMSSELLTKINNFISVAFERHLNERCGDPNGFINVEFDQAGGNAMNQFDEHCLNNIEAANKSGSPMAGMWARCKEHVGQIASLIAIGVNDVRPIVTQEYVQIATRIVMPTLGKIAGRVESGDMGMGDERLEAEIKKFIRRCAGNWNVCKGMANMKRDIIEAGYVPSSAIRAFVTRLAAFKNHRMGSSKAFDDTMRTLVAHKLVIECEVQTGTGSIRAVALP